MGKNNRARRAAKQRKRQVRDDRARCRPTSASAGSTSAPIFTQSEWLAGMFDLAPRRLVLGDQQFVDSVVERMREMPPKAIHRFAEAELLRSVAAMWSGGWQPVEVVRQVRRGGSVNSADLAKAAIVGDHAIRSACTIDARWMAQLAELALPEVAGPGPTGWFVNWARTARLDLDAQITIAFEVIASLRSLPRIAELIPPPGSARPNEVTGTSHSDTDRRVLDKVRSLLVKAESTTFQAESEALTAKAHELMTRYAIDVAMVGATKDAGGERPVTRRIAIDDPYVDSKSLLLQVVAEAGRCRSVLHGGLGMSSVVGFPADVSAVEMLFTSLLVQAQASLTEASRRAPAGSRPRSRSFRSAFLLAYADRIGQRLAAISDSLIAEAEASTGHAVLPALRDRADVVGRFVDDQFPNLGSHTVRGGHDAAGWARGRIAGDIAQLSFGDVESGAA